MILSFESNNQKNNSYINSVHAHVESIKDLKLKVETAETKTR